ncbi:hypothetical protein BKA80DRAFT_95745 [Phyllosticta citrichinensis]
MPYEHLTSISALQDLVNCIQSTPIETSPPIPINRPRPTRRPSSYLRVGQRFYVRTPNHPMINAVSAMTWCELEWMQGQERPTQLLNLHQPSPNQSNLTFDKCITCQIHPNKPDVPRRLQLGSIQPDSSYPWSESLGMHHLLDPANPVKLPQTCNR